MKRLFAALCALAFVSLISPLTPLRAQSRVLETKGAGPLSYDISKEVTLSGTVQSVLTKHSPGMIMGSHILIETSSGAVDASLGRFGLQGNGAVKVAGGQQIEVTGVMKTIKDKQVLMARIVKVGEKVYTIRNEHGVAVSPQGREHQQKEEGL